MKKFLKRIKNDKGDASLISLVIAIPLVLGILFTIIDSGIYFMNSQSVSSAARDAARTVAIYGGNGDADNMTTIEKAYGAKNNCTASADTLGKTANKTSTECGLADMLSHNSLLVGVKIEKVTCTPRITTGIGQDIKCTVSWTYSGVPGSGLGFIKNSKTGQSPFSNNTTIGSAKSEVKLNTSDLVSK